jgi:hypothetical protein
MKYRVLATVAAVAVIAFARPATYLAQEARKAADVLALAHKAIGDKKLDTLKTFSVQSAVQRNVASMQLNSDVEILIEMPDKYARMEQASGGPGMVVAGAGTTGFNGDRPLQKVDGGGMGGGMVIRMGGGGSFSNGPAEKKTPEQIDQLQKSMLRSSRIDASRLMLGWFAMAHPAAQAEYVYAGEAESVEGKAYVVDVKNADGLAARLFIDEQTNLPLMVTYKAAAPRVMNQTMSMPAGGHVMTAPSQADAEKQVREFQRQEPVMADYTVYFEDWRDADGVKFPFKMRRAMGGTTTEEWTVSKIKVNPKIDAKKFAVDNGS